MTIEKERSGNIPAFIAEKAISGRREQWSVSFEHSVADIPDEDIIKALSAVAWLWSPKICRAGSKSIVYSGYID